MLVPVTFCRVNGERGQVRVSSITAEQFADVPRLARDDRLTLLEEERICAYYGGGHLYAMMKGKEEEAAS